MSKVLTIGEPAFHEYEDGELVLFIEPVTWAEEDRAAPDSLIGNHRTLEEREFFTVAYEAGLSKLLFGPKLIRASYDVAALHRDDGLLCQEGEVIPLMPEDLAAIKQAKVETRDALKLTTAGKRVLDLLLWLEYWVEWALKHCDEPALTYGNRGE